MKIKVLATIILVALTGTANAANLIITDGNLESVAQWNNNFSGDPTLRPPQDNGEATPPVWLAFAPFPAFNWDPLPNANQNGTYSGNLVYDPVTGEVTGGSLIVTGSIGYAFDVGGNSWWYHQHDNLNIDFATGTATSAYQCSFVLFAPATCAAGGAVPASGIFAPLAGNEGIGGTARLGAHYDGAGTLTIFHEGYAGDIGTDYMTQFSVVPVPAAVWLFGSALGLLGGWSRYRGLLANLTASRTIRFLKTQTV